MFAAIHQQRQNLAGDQQIIHRAGPPTASTRTVQRAIEVLHQAEQIERAKQLQDAHQVAGVLSIGVVERLDVEMAAWRAALGVWR